MNIEEILNQMIAERDKLNVAIAALQGIGAPKRRGRPRKNPLAEVTAAPAAKARRPKRTQAQRDAQAARMRKYWEQRKKQAATEPKPRGKKS